MLHRHGHILLVAKITSEEGMRTCFRVQDPTLPGSILHSQSFINNPSPPTCQMVLVYRLWKFGFE